MDLSRLNRIMAPCCQVHLVLRLNSWLMAVDLENRYWLISIHPRFQKFMAVQVGQDTYQFKVMPISLKVAARVCTKLTMVIAKFLSAHYVQFWMYLDKWLIQSPSEVRCHSDSATVLEVCHKMAVQGQLTSRSPISLRPRTLLGLEWSGMLNL